MAYNSSIDQQFKFTQRLWVNNTDFPFRPGVPHGIDPVIGQGINRPGDQKLSTEWDDPAAPRQAESFSGFVKFKGGDYFFSPSLTFFKNL
jgi:hypothetical protein